MIHFGQKKRGTGRTKKHASSNGYRALCGFEIPEDWETAEWGDGPDCVQCKKRVHRMKSLESVKSRESLRGPSGCGGVQYPLAGDKLLAWVGYQWQEVTFVRYERETGRVKLASGTEVNVKVEHFDLSRKES